MKTSLKNYLTFSILCILSFCFIHWYLVSQQVIPDIAISFYHKYASFNQITDNNFSEGMKTLFESVQTDTRNMIFALMLRPVWLFFGKSFETYVLSIFILFFVPSMYVFYRFINKFGLGYCAEFPFFKVVPMSLVFLIPLFLYNLLIGYPDIFSLGLVVFGLFYFFKAKISEKTDFKNLSLFSILCFASFLFRRWIFFVWGCFLLSAAIFYFCKIVFSKFELKNKIKNLFVLAKNLLFCGVAFFALLFVFANGVLHDMFDPQFRQLFQDYAIPLSQNFNAVVKWINPLIWSVLAIYLILFSKTTRAIKNKIMKHFDFSAEMSEKQKFYYENLSKRNDVFAFALLNIFVYFFVLGLSSEICLDHMMWIMLCGLVCLVIALYSIVLVLPHKKICSILIILFSVVNIYFACFEKPENQEKNCISYVFSQGIMPPKKVPNLEIIKATENVIREKVEKNPDFHYSLWFFWNDVFNPHLIFQEAVDSDLFNRGEFPPLVDTESIVQNWYFMPIIVTDTIFVLEPTRNYLADKDKCKILSKTQELIKNKQGFGSAFELKDKKYFGEFDGKDVYLLQYDRIRSVTKADFDDYKNRVLEWYPWAKEYFPDYFENLWKNNK